MKYVEDLHFIHFNTQNPGIYSRECESAYELWEKEWQNTFNDLGVSKDVMSDDFLHRELGGLFLNGKAVGFLLYHFLDLNRQSHQKTQYWENYPSSLKFSHHLQKDEIMVMTYMTLSPEWRKSNTDLPISELLIGFSVLRLLESRTSRLIGYFRNNRKTNEIFYRHGGRPLLLNHEAYNVQVDFGEIRRETAHLSTLDHCSSVTQKLWNQFKFRENQRNQLPEENYVFNLYQREHEKIDRLYEKNALEQSHFL